MTRKTSKAWFFDLKPKAQKAYIKAHPNSKYAKMGTKHKSVVKSILRPKPPKAVIRKHKAAIKDVPRWTDKVDAKSAKLFKTLTMAQIRKRQRLAEEQMVSAYKAKNERVLNDLNKMHDALTREMLRRSKDK